MPSEHTKHELRTANVLLTCKKLATKNLSTESLCTCLKLSRRVYELDYTDADMAHLFRSEEELEK